MHFVYNSTPHLFVGLFYVLLFCVSLVILRRQPQTHFPLPLSQRAQRFVIRVSLHVLAPTSNETRLDGIENNGGRSSCNDTKKAQCQTWHLSTKHEDGKENKHHRPAQHVHRVPEHQVVPIVRKGFKKLHRSG